MKELETKYYSPPIQILFFKTDDSFPIYVLKEGKEGKRKINEMHRDIKELIRELKKHV